MMVAGGNFFALAGPGRSEHSTPVISSSKPKKIL
jgi:hypothetical protein